MPLAVIVSGRLDLPADLPILHNPDARVAIVTAVDETIDGVEADVVYLLEPATRELAPALHALRTEHGVRSIVCEGGPRLNSSLLREGLVDELWLCVSPRIAGDPAQPATVEGEALPAPVDLDWCRCTRRSSTCSSATACATRPQGTAVMQNPCNCTVLLQPLEPHW